MFIVCHAHFYTNIQSHRPPHNSFSRAAHCRNCVAAKSMIKCSSCVVPNFTLKFIHTGHRTIPFACCTLQKLRCLIEHDRRHHVQLPAVIHFQAVHNFFRVIHTAELCCRKEHDQKSSRVVPSFTLKFSHTGHRTIPFCVLRTAETALLQRA